MSIILVIDDKQDNLLSISSLLKNLIPGCRMLTAQSGPEGIEKAKAEPVDTILLDIHMPGMDGFEVCKILKSDEATKHIPIIMLTAVRRETESLVKGLELGADAFFTKPIDKSELTAQVRAMLRIKKAEDQLLREKDLLAEKIQIRTTELKESETKHKDLYDNAPDMFCSVDAKTEKIIQCNQTLAHQTGYTKEEIIGRPILEIYHPDCMEEANKTFRSFLTTGDVYNAELQLRRKDGSKIDVCLNASSVRDEHGNILYSRSIWRDVSERNIAQKALQLSEGRLRTIFEQAPLGIALIDSITGHVYEVNLKFAQIAGRTIEEMATVDWMSITHPDDVQEDLDNMALLNAGKINVFNMNKRYIHLDGSEVWINMTIAPVKVVDKSHPRHLCMIQNISEQKRAEENMRQSQKMEAMGTLAGGIAHDFNNILAAIIGYAELAQCDTAENSLLKDYLERILKSTTRAKDLVRQILTFSRKSQEERKPIQLSTIVKEAAKLLRSTIPTTIEIKQNIDDTTGRVNADPTQMHQIVMNLCTNAAHAMHETEGVLEIDLSSVVITQESMMEYHDIFPGPFLELKISDTGTGIDSKIIHRIFEPFFTTKEKGKGTGMGLAVVHGIVKDHGGDISIDSQLGKGTTFRIMLPQVIAEPNNEEDSSSKVPTGTEHILFVDDEKTLIDLGKRIFESLGYTVTAKNSSLEALETFQQAPDTFDIVITDQTMPHMTGYNLAKRILEIKPSANIILCTGYSETVSLEKAEAAGIKTLVYKPISKKEIAQEIRGVLDKGNHKN